MSLEDWERIVGVNLWGVIHGCHYFYPRMIEQGGGGHIVNTASIGGLTPFPIVTAYCCTKYGVVGLSETLRAEAALHGVGVSVICPGTTDTDICKTGKMVSWSKRSTPDEWLERMDKALTLRNYPPSRVAEAAVKAVERNRGVVVITPEACLADLLHRLSRRFYGFLMKGFSNMMRRL
jgi:short-subunit dehydrogenase